MTTENQRLLDNTGWRILEELQENARLTLAELGRRVALSAPAVAERLQRLEAVGAVLVDQALRLDHQVGHQRVQRRPSSMPRFGVPRRPSTRRR